MGAIGDPQSLVPYMNNRDCSQGFCSIYCPQWCYIIFPPPPPLEFPSNYSISTPSLSPLVIAVIGILASAFLLVAYYTIISKFCITSDPSESHENSEEHQENHNPSLQEPWETRNAGLDEALIKSIAVYKYKKGSSGTGETDCSVCLSEFQDDESLRLLPKCNHAFHVYCIDRWLKSHSNCPNCRANVILFPSSLPPPISNHHLPNDHDSSDNDDNAITDTNTDRRNPETENVMQSESSFRAYSNLGSSQVGAIVIEIRDESYQHIRRSVSMDLSCQQTRIVDILQMNQDDDEDVGTSSKQSLEMSKTCNKKRIKRSFSSGRFNYAKQGRVRDTIMPL